MLETSLTISLSTRFHSEPVRATCVFIWMPEGAGPRGLEESLGNGA